jgi:ubiquinone/menaquinone biosynthesis C-methylase UbiE
MNAAGHRDSIQAQFNTGASKRVEAIYLTPDVVKQREHAIQRLAPQPGERVLDIGCGPGLTTLALADAVGPQGLVHAVDIAEPMLELARSRCATQAHVHFEKQDATRLLHADDAFDIALATQVYEYLPDVDQALRELHRVVRPGGRVLLVDTDWESAVWASRDDARMRNVLETWNQHIPWPQLPRQLQQRLLQAGFTDIEVEVMPLLNTRFDRQTYSVGMLEVISAFVRGRAACTAQLVADWQADVCSMDEHTGYFFSLNRYVFSARA